METLYVYITMKVNFGNDDLDVLQHTGLPSHSMLLRAVVMICNIPELAGLTSHGPWTRHIDPRSILAEQCTMLDEATKVGMQNTDAHICAPSHLVHKCVYIYLTSTGNFPQSGNQLRHHKNLKSFFHSHSKLSALDTLSLSISDLTLTPFPIIRRPQ